MQLPPNIQCMQTQYGPQFVDVTTGMIVQMQPQGVGQPAMQGGGYPQQQGYHGQVHRANVGQPQYQPMGRVTGGQVQAYYPETQETVDNRYGDASQQNAQPRLLQQPNQVQDTTQMRVPTNPSNTVTIIEQKKFIPGKKLLKSSNTIGILRTRPFMQDEVRHVNLEVLSGGFSVAVETLYEEAHKIKEKNNVVVVGSCILAEPFYGTSVRGLVNELFQPNIEDVYRFMKSAIANLTTRGDIIFMSEYNQWLTDQINDFLKVLVTKPLDIDSFVEDFNDLKRYLGDTKTVDETLGTIYEELCRRLRSSMLAAVDLHKEEKELIDPDVVCLVETGNLVFCKLMSTELWEDGVPDDDKSGNRLISSLFDHDISDLFYLITLDKVIYKVIKTVEGNVSVELLGS